MGESVLSPAERAEVERIVGGAIATEAIVWERPQVVRIETATDRFIAKRPWRDGSADPPETARLVHRAERAALELLSAMPDSPAPALLGASDDVDILVMEHLPPAPSVADALLGDDRAAADAAVVGLAETLARVHAWTTDREPEYQAIRRRLDLPRESQRWSDVTDAGIDQFRRTAAALGVETPPVFEAEARQVVERLRAPGWWRGLVHGDPCPDNTSVIDGQVRLFDFEHTNFGSVLLDASYVMAPFPTCWCFGRLPPALSERAVAAYRRVLATVHPEAADDEAWGGALAVALCSWILARGAVVERAVTEDGEWGTTTIRPRLLQWMDAFLAAESSELPGLTATIADLRAALGDRWSDARLPDYPSLPTPGDHPTVQAPAWFQGWPA